MKAPDKRRLSQLEKELTDCFTDRYLDNLAGFYEQNPDVGKMSEELSRYIDSRPVSAEPPTYYRYWDEKMFRQRLWYIERDPIARGMLARIQKASKDIIDGRSLRLKLVGDSGHSPVQVEGAANLDAGREAEGNAVSANEIGH